VTELVSMEFHPQPLPGEAKPWAFPAPERGTLDNGLTVLRCHRPGQSLPQLRRRTLIFAAGCEISGPYFPRVPAP